MKRIAVVLWIVTLSLVVGAQTNDPSALVRLGHDASMRGEPEKAAEYFEKAVALKPNDAGFHYQLANAYGQAASSAGMFGAISMAKKAKAEWERAIQLDPNFLLARYALLQFYVGAPSVMGGSESGALE